MVERTQGWTGLDTHIQNTYRTLATCRKRRTWRMFLEENETVPYSALRYTAAEALRQNATDWLEGFQEVHEGLPFLPDWILSLKR